MEVFLNLAWSLLAAIMFFLWLIFAPRTGRNWRVQFIALAVLLLILFPVISVTDDLLVVQNPAEADTSLRRDHADRSPHSSFPAVATFPVPAFAALSMGRPKFTTGGLFIPINCHLALNAVQSRPPPLA
jgi:hypothetical protein